MKALVRSGCGCVGPSELTAPSFSESFGFPLCPWCARWSEALGGKSISGCYPGSFRVLRLGKKLHSQCLSCDATE